MTSKALAAENTRLREYLTRIKNYVPHKTTVHKQSDWARMTCDAVRKIAIEALNNGGKHEV